MPIQVLMPALSPTMAEGNLVKWHKKEGDVIKSGQVLAEIETDKATMEVEAVDEGVLGKILVPEGTESVAVNALIAVILEEGEDKAVLEAFLATHATVAVAAVPAPVAAEVKTVATPAPMPAPTVSMPAPAPLQTKSDSRVAASPLARRLAAERGIDLAHLEGSGPRGRVVKSDLNRMGGAMSLRPAPRSGDGLFPNYEEIKLTNMRKVIAQRLTESKQQVPHFYLNMDVTLDGLLDLRRQINSELDEKARISVNDLIIKACALALKKVPDANASFYGDHVKRFMAADISVAVAIDGGLVTPIVRDAEMKSVSMISLEMKDLAARARAGKLKPQEFQGGTFSISNLGMYGISSFSAVINPPQGCILAVGAGEKRAVVVDGAVQIATVMTLTLSVDHRVVDGAVGAHFLNALKHYLTNPALLLM